MDLKKRERKKKTVWQILRYGIILSGIICLIMAVILPIAEQARKDERVYGTATIVRFEFEYVKSVRGEHLQKTAIVSHPGGESTLSSFRSSYKVGMTFDGYYYPKEPELFYPEGSDWVFWAIPLGIGIFSVGLGGVILFCEKQGTYPKRYTYDDFDF